MRPQTVEKKAATRNGVSRLAFALLSMLLESLLLAALLTGLNRYAEWVNIITRVVGLILGLVIYGQHKTSSMKMPWIILMLLFPVFGVAMYLMVGLNVHTRRMRERYEKIDGILLPLLPENKEELEELTRRDGSAGNIASYIAAYAKYPVYRNTDVTYFDQAVKGLEAQLAAMAQAERFIFIEYHAIEDKDVWQRIQEVLVERVCAGVEVRVFYDDLGSIGFITTDFIRRLEALGIRCRVFNPFAPGLNLFLNNRDHRKLTIVDGRVGFTGGYNLANEYFNITKPYGEWKDTGIMISGEAVRSMTVTFLEMWNAVKRSDVDDTDFGRYLPDIRYEAKEPEGFAAPYADNPMDDLHVGEDVYISMADKAEKYCYFSTPYLIITDEMMHALGLAAMRGVDVRIITPGIPDKKMVYGVTRSFYNGLVRRGVRIYEWTPGFFHAKMSIADDRMATCGTINLDYRSLYHHFENGCFFCHCEAVHAMKADFDASFAECREVTEFYRTGRSGLRRLWQLFLRLFAELM
ncbi:phospholipase D-like domain-containing protein [Lachnoclostridium sp. Marseille-P6806]|uniref:phospholipase D-like domain-containing protein n=1 Tax=Lachnoclostridium sp. Marseille-P6806 TaxID=2364793 RepID=UPI00103129D1|nr:phospholipase D-like domain-containing protein [Lachnoclostridium sp. Marseille-P6806]